MSHYGPGAGVARGQPHQSSVDSSYVVPREGQSSSEFAPPPSMTAAGVHWRQQPQTGQALVDWGSDTCQPLRRMSDVSLSGNFAGPSSAGSGGVLEAMLGKKRRLETQHAAGPAKVAKPSSTLPEGVVQIEALLLLVDSIGVQRCHLLFFSLLCSSRRCQFQQSTWGSA
jgi:hypothetical protein